MDVMIITEARSSHDFQVIPTAQEFFKSKKSVSSQEIYTLRVQAAVDPNLPRRRFHKPNPSHAFLYPMQAVTPNDNTGR